LGPPARLCGNFKRRTLRQNRNLIQRPLFCARRRIIASTVDTVGRRAAALLSPSHDDDTGNSRSQKDKDTNMLGIIY